MAPRRTWHRKKRKRKEKKEAEEKKKSEPQADPSMQNTAYNNHADNGSLQILAPTSFGAYNDIRKPFPPTEFGKTSDYSS